MARGEFISALYASPHCKSTMWKCFPVAVLKLLLRLLESLWERKSWYSQDILATKLVFPGRCQGLSAHLLWFDWFLTICHFWDLPHCPWCSPTCDPSPWAALSIFPPSAFHFKTEKKKKKKAFGGFGLISLAQQRRSLPPSAAQCISNGNWCRARLGLGLPPAKLHLFYGNVGMPSCPANIPSLFNPAD